MHLSRGGWTLLGTVTFGLAVLTSCTKIGADDPARHRPVAVGDDQPIIIAGGSMYFVAPVGYQFMPDADPKTLLFGVLNSSSASTDRWVSSVDVIEPDNTLTKTPLSSGQDLNIVIEYDQKKGGGGNEKEEVTITAPNRHNLTITSSLPDNIRKAKAHSPRFWSHFDKDKSISKISVNGVITKDCKAYGECAVVIHYCIDSAGTCIER